MAGTGKKTSPASAESVSKNCSRSKLERSERAKRVRGGSVPPPPNRTEKSAIRRLLLEWYGRAKRDLPWRRTKDPYAIWVSEVMLQQTRVSTVIPYYVRFMQRFPDLSSLGRAHEDAVLHAWQGLGYYSRARGLLSGARAVLERHAGELPRDPSALALLPGIGPYTAGAIASIAFGVRAPSVDGNVVRVLTRLFALAGSPTAGPLKSELWRLAGELVPEGRAADFNQALMELGATVCTSRAPRCERCPLGRICRARAGGLTQSLPTPKKPARPTRVANSAGVLVSRGRLLLVQLPGDAPRWAGMWCLPTREPEAGESGPRAAARAVRELTGIRVRVFEELTSLQHAVTRFRITLTAYRCERMTGRARPNARWVTRDELHALAMPAPQRKIAARVGTLLS